MTRLCLTAALAALFALIPLPGAAADNSPLAGDYVRVQLDREGAAPPGELDGMAARIRQQLGTGEGPIIVLVHGFAQKDWTAEANYQVSASRLKADARRLGYSPAVVGVHWDSDVGSMSQWMARAAGARLTSLLGLKKAVRNPYLAKSALAGEVGRTGLRAVLFRLQDDFPGRPLHLVAHSLGAEVVVTALAPTRGRSRSSDGVQPGRELRVETATLVGADLDHDAFSARHPETRAALDRARVWWITTPRNGVADAVLELRRGAGRPDAVGNVGLKLEPGDLDALLQRRALVVDERDIPATHSMTRYLSEARTQSLAASILYLQDPRSAAAQGSILAGLDAILAGSPPGVGAAGERSFELYAAWKARPDRVAGFRSDTSDGRERRGPSRQREAPAAAAGG